MGLKFKTIRLILQRIILTLKLLIPYISKIIVTATTRPLLLAVLFLLEKLRNVSFPFLFAVLFKNLLTLDVIQVPENVERTWIDRVLDAIVGENDGPQSKFALICASCFTHNGLVLPSEYASASMSFLSWPFLTISLNCKKSSNA